MNRYATIAQNINYRQHYRLFYLAAFVIAFILAHFAVKSAFNVAEYLPHTPTDQTAVQGEYEPNTGINTNNTNQEPTAPEIWTTDPMAGVVYEPAPETDTERGSK